MTSTRSPQGKAAKYIRRIQQLGNYDVITPWPGLKALRRFVEDPSPCLSRSKISIVSIPGEGGNASEVSISDLKGPHDLLGQLPSLTATSSDSQIIVIENLCPATLTILGGYYDIDPQFFAEYVQVLSWYQMFEPIPERLPPLPSTKKEEAFLSLRYVSTRELQGGDDTSISGRSVIWPNMINTRIGHSAGRMKPIPGKTVLERKKNYPPIAFTRQTISVWCKKKTDCIGWIAIMLVDGPFQLHRKYGTLGEAEYRDPTVRSEAGEEFFCGETRRSFREAFCTFFTRRCSKDQMYRKNCAVDIFLALYEGYRIIASEWLVVNEYVKRELANIERNLEKKESTFQELEQHLKELYRIRRRYKKDQELVMEAISQCENRGQTLWHSSQTKSNLNAGDIAFSDRHAHELEKDFEYVLSNMRTTISRIEKDIGHLMALVSIGEGRQSLQENRGISFLTLVAMIFLPSQTVASVLGIQTQFGPEANDFWVLWAVALPITALVIVAASLYPAASAKLKLLTNICTRFIRGRPKFARNSSNESQNKDIEFDEIPALLIHQNMIGGMV